MPSPLTFFLSELDNSHVPIAGGKAASLGELIHASVPVPPGFVVTSAAFDAFLTTANNREHIQQILQKLNNHQIEASAAASQIRAALDPVPMPGEVVAAIKNATARLDVERVAVRSSATCEDSGARAWAGQLQTYLDVPPEHIVERVRDCWLSAFSETALAYGAAHGFDAALLSVPVVVQQIIASDISGIGFSVHPVTQEANMQLIEACFGMGEAIASGYIVPDQYVVTRDTNQIVETIVGDQDKGLFIEPGTEPAWRTLDARGKTRKLNDAQVVEYATMLSRIQDHYGFPVDTEWALQGEHFFLLQARPITTLADEYQEPLIGDADHWQPLVRRPLSLLESSIILRWTDAKHADKTLGLHVDHALAIQDEGEMVNLILPKADMRDTMRYLVDLQQNHRSHLIEILRRGEDIYRDSQARINKGTKAFRDFEEAIEFFCYAAQHTTAFPAWTLIALDDEGINDPEVVALAEKLRSRTLYPFIERRIIEPFAQEAAKTLGFSSPIEAAKVLTCQELQQGSLDLALLEERLDAVRQGRHFVLRYDDGQDHVRFVSQTGYLLMRIAKQRRVIAKTNSNELSGQSAWPGIYRGRARVILGPDAVGQTFEDGEVLISIQSNPSLMPLLKRCGAIVTDDGGVACHAAILARELRKPTLIGTGNATSLIRTGDLLEVDTYAQIVRILEPAAQEQGK